MNLQPSALSLWKNWSTTIRGMFRLHFSDYKKKTSISVEKLCWLYFGDILPTRDFPTSDFIPGNPSHPRKLFDHLLAHRKSIGSASLNSSHLAQTKILASMWKRRLQLCWVRQHLRLAMQWTELGKRIIFFVGAQGHFYQIVIIEEPEDGGQCTAVVGGAFCESFKISNSLEVWCIGQIKDQTMHISSSLKSTRIQQEKFSVIFFKCAVIFQ